MKAILTAFVIFLANFGLMCESNGQELELEWVEQDVQCISVAHLDDGVELIFFWSAVQGEWTCLDHRWASCHSTIVFNPALNKWSIAWNDESEKCYRVITTSCWVESWENESPLNDQNQRPWFRQLLNPGLKGPKGKK